MAITYVERKHKNNGTSVLIHPRNIEKQYHEKLLLNFLLKYEVDFPSKFVHGRIIEED